MKNERTHHRDSGIGTWLRIRKATVAYAVGTAAIALGMAVAAGVDAVPAWALSPPALIVVFVTIPAAVVAWILSSHVRNTVELTSQASDPAVARYRRVLESPRSCLIVHDGSSIVEASRGAIELLGVPRSRIIDAPVDAFFDPASVLWSGQEEERSPVLQAELISPDGARRPVDVSVCRVERGADPEWIVVLNDLSRRRVVEDALEHNLLFHTTLVNTIPNPLFFKNSDGAYVDCNAAFSEFFGKPKERIVGRTVFDLLPRPQAEELAALDARLMANDESITYEATVSDGAGKAAQVLVNLAPFHSRTGVPIGLVGIQADITERKRMEEELHAAKEEAEEANRTKTRFLAHMTHEFRTPMNAILGYARLLQESVSSVEDRERLELVARHGEHLLDLVNDLLDLSRLESGRVRPTYQTFALGEMVDEVAEAFALDAASKGLRLESTTDLPRSEMVIGDRDRIRQILYNLLSNAVKFCADGGVTIEVRRPEADVAVEFAISDTGPGVPEDRRESIFSPFERAEHRVSNAPGTGLGLAICRELATLLGGTVELTATSEAGSTFVVTIPLPRTDQHAGIPDTRRRSKTFVQEHAAIPSRLPPREAVERLSRFAAKGDIAAITEVVQSEMTGDFQEFYRLLGTHAARFEIQRIREILDTAKGMGQNDGT